jgi:hypothetical protein
MGCEGQLSRVQAPERQNHRGRRAGILVAPASAQLASCAVGGPDIVCTAQGAIRGVVEGETLAFTVPLSPQPTRLSRRNGSAG